MAKRCKPCSKVARTCKKRKGSARFTAPCKAKFRACQKEVLKETGSMRIAGKKCMTALHVCAGSRTQKTAVKKYKKARG